MAHESVDQAMEPFAEELQPRGSRSDSGWTRSFEVELHRKDGTKFWAEFDMNHLLDDEGELIGTVGVTRDISERKAAEAEIHKLSDALEVAADIIFMTDADGNIEYANKAFESITGFSKDEAIGQNPRILKSGLMSPEYYDEVYKTLLSGEVFRGVVVNKTKSGELFDYDQTISPHIDSDGNIIGFVSTGKDVTERRRARELEKSRLRGELTGFFVSSLPVFAAGITPAIREKIIKTFSDRFESNILPRFTSEVTCDVGPDIATGREEEFDCWMTWLVDFLTNIGISTEFKDDTLLFATCPWEEEAKENAIFCLMCRTMIIRSSTWINTPVKVNQKSVIAQGSNNCVFNIAI